MGFTVTTELIETRESIEAMTDIYCDSLQGYFFSKPLPMDSLAEQSLRNLLNTSMKASDTFYAHGFADKLLPTNSSSMMLWLVRHAKVRLASSAGDP